MQALARSSQLLQSRQALKQKAVILASSDDLPAAVVLPVETVSDPPVQPASDPSSLSSEIPSHLIPETKLQATLPTEVTPTLPIIVAKGIDPRPPPSTKMMTIAHAFSSTDEFSAPTAAVSPQKPLHTALMSHASPATKTAPVTCTPPSSALAAAKAAMLASSAYLPSKRASGAASTLAVVESTNLDVNESIAGSNNATYAFAAKTQTAESNTDASITNLGAVATAGSSLLAAQQALLASSALLKKK
mmetsp:Transcript_48713/g.95524  ORF Transcript_48713/g.95524 Transcript_48713/m.95524 type:complete len:247 (-) Transcript_48713:45-785(-)